MKRILAWILIVAMLLSFAVSIVSGLHIGHDHSEPTISQHDH